MGQGSKPEFERLKCSEQPCYLHVVGNAGQGAMYEGFVTFPFV